MTPDDVRSVTFEQVRKGYRVEDVDDFLLQVGNEMERLMAECDRAMADRDRAMADREPLARELQEARAAKEDAEQKLYVLAAKVEEYRGQEETLKTALINAQRMGETVVHEAKQKADQMLREATGASELLRQKAEQDAIKERSTLESLVGEVNRFKTTVLNLYKQHIESMSALDPPVARAEEVLKKQDEPQEEAPQAEEAEEQQTPLGNAEPELPPAEPAPPAAAPAGRPEPEPEEAPPAVDETPKPGRPPALFGGELIDD